MDSLTSWLVVTITLFVLGVVFPVAGAIRTYRQGVRKLGSAEAAQGITAEFQSKWAAEQKELSDALAARTMSSQEFGERSEANNKWWHDEFEAHGLPTPDVGSLTRMMNGENNVSLMRLLIDRNGFNLALILTGPVLATTASIIALFPGWDLP